MDVWEQMRELEPSLRYIDIEAETLGHDHVILQLSARKEIFNHTGGVHGGAQFALGEATGVTAAGLTLGKPLDCLLALKFCNMVLSLPLLRYHDENTR